MSHPDDDRDLPEAEEPIYSDEDDDDFDASNEHSEPTRTAGLSAICILAMILGGVGVLTSCAGLGGQMFGRQFQQALSTQPRGMQQDAFKIQAEMNARALEIQNRYIWYTVPLLILKLGFEIALLAGGIMAWGLKPGGRKVFLVALIGTLAVESIQMVPNTMMQLETRDLMAEMMPRMMGNQAGPQGNAFAQGFSIVYVVALIFSGIWFLAKAIYYILGVNCLRSAHVIDAFRVPDVDRE